MNAPLSPIDIRRHQIARQVELEQLTDYYDRLSTTLTDPEARAEALRLAVETAAQANRIRTAVALSNWTVPETADEEARREERERDTWHKEWRP